MFEFTKTEYEYICKECMLNDEYKKLLEMKQKYMSVSNTLFELFMVEHNNIGKMFKGE